MLKEGIAAFEKMLQKYGDRFVVSAYTLKEGTYRLIYMTEGDWRLGEPIDIYYDRKKKEMIGDTHEDYNYIRLLDYYSKLIEMNKPMDPKKQIHTCNYLSLACKKEKLLQNVITPEIYAKFYDILRDPAAKYAGKKQSKLLYEKTEEELGPVDADLVNRIKEFVLTNDVWAGIDLDKKNYAKVFFVFEDENRTISLYKKEYKRYMLPNVFNKNDFNQEIDGIIYGLPGDNLGLNQKKPFLEHRTRKFSVPRLVSQREALLQRQLFDFLLGEASKGKYNVLVSDQIVTYTDEDEPPLDDGSGSTYYRTKIGGNGDLIIMRELKVQNSHTRLNPYFRMNDYLDLSEKVKEKMPYDQNIQKKWALFRYIDFILFDSRLKNNLFVDSSDIKINEAALKREILATRDFWISWIYSGDLSGLKWMFERAGLDLICSSLTQNYVYKAKNQFNFWISVLEYLQKNNKGGMYEMLTDIRAHLWQGINSDGHADWQIENDCEYAYAVGQMVLYFLSLSHANDKNCSIINLFVIAPDGKTINDRLIKLYKKYSYDIPNGYKNSTRVGEMISHILDYVPTVIKKEYIIAGFMSASLIYKKNSEEDQ